MTSADRELERVNRLLEPACQLSSSLGTFSNVLYFLACINNRGVPIKENLHAFINGDLSAIRANNRALAHGSSIGALGALLYQARSILRLFRIVPLLVRLRQIIKTPEKDRTLWWTKLTECGLFTLYQAIENAATLIDYKILPKNLLARLKSDDPTSVYTLAYRVWMLGVSCRMFLIFRHIQNWLRDQSSNADGPIKIQKVDPPSTNHLWMFCWLPVGWTLSAWTEHELPGLHMIMHSIGDGITEARHHSQTWHETAAVGKPVA